VRENEREDRMNGTQRILLVVMLAVVAFTTAFFTSRWFVGDDQLLYGTPSSRTEVSATR
jgi:hypothetical protein